MVVRLVLMLLTMSLGACASMSPDYEKPVVSLSYFRPSESDGGIPGFEVGLKILNPNRQALNLEGVVYTISIQGEDIIKGVGKGFEPIEGYSEGDIVLTAAPNLLAGIKLLSQLMNESADSLDYEFEAKLDVGGFYPSIRVKESGEFKLGSQGTKAQQKDI
jgi:hypothetical protein